MLSARAVKWPVLRLGRRKGPVLFMSFAITRSRRAISAAAAESVILGIRASSLLHGAPALSEQRIHMGLARGWFRRRPTPGSADWCALVDSLGALVGLAARSAK